MAFPTGEPPDRDSAPSQPSPVKVRGKVRPPMHPKTLAGKFALSH